MQIRCAGFYLAGAAAARTGDEMSGPALLLAGFAVSGSVTEASSLLAAVTAAAAVGGPVLGAFLDRSARPGRLLAGALALYGAGLVLILAALGRLPFAFVLAIAVGTGLSGPALSGGWTAQLPRVVPPERLPRATALDAMTFSAAGLAGPALAGTAAGLLGAPAAVGLSVVLIGAGLPVAWGLPGRVAGVRRDREALPQEATAHPDPDPKKPRGTRGTVIGDLAAGVRCIVRSPSLARATLTSVASCAAQGMLVTCTPLLGARSLGGAGHGARLLSGIAVASLVANAALARFPGRLAPDTVVRTGALIQAAALALAATGRPALLATAVLLAGAGEGPQLTALFALRHREAPEWLRSQVFVTGASLKITGFALGAAVAGPMIGRSLPGTLLTAAGVQAVGALGGAARRKGTLAAARPFSKQGGTDT
ncbi:MFS transporter [Streptomyces sp. NPDC051636]|uniref:MFS transporter n=1 Tax=Streptomyces sp. NPDC051636 TaxID=3365663 RepID=UPI0037B8D8A9